MKIITASLTCFALISNIVIAQDQFKIQLQHFSNKKVTPKGVVLPVNVAVWEEKNDRYYGLSNALLDTLVWSKEHAESIVVINNGKQKGTCRVEKKPAKANTVYGNLYRSWCTWEAESKGQEQPIEHFQLWSDKIGVLLIVGRAPTGSVAVEINQTRVPQEIISSWFELMD